MRATSFLHLVESQCRVAADGRMYNLETRGAMESMFHESRVSRKLGEEGAGRMQSRHRVMQVTRRGWTEDTSRGQRIKNC